MHFIPSLHFSNSTLNNIIYSYSRTSFTFPSFFHWSNTYTHTQNPTLLHLWAKYQLCNVKNMSASFFKDFIYFIFRERGREGERVRNINVWLPLAWPLMGPCPQPRHVPWLGIKPAMLCFTGLHSIHWAIWARACLHLNREKCYILNKIRIIKNH